MPRTLVVMALRAESAGVFETAQVPVLYSGVGKINAAMALMRELMHYRHAGQELPLVVNFGTAGSRCHAAGSLVSCHEFVQRDMDVRAVDFALGVTPYDDAPACLRFDPIFLQLPAALCGSGDSFATADVPVDCSVVDMEAFALARVCWQEKAQFACAKYISDGADGAAGSDWKDNVHKAAEQFLRLLQGMKRHD